VAFSNVIKSLKEKKRPVTEGRGCSY